MTPAPCPRCGTTLQRGYRAVSGDPDDVEPWAECPADGCDFSY